MRPILPLPLIPWLLVLGSCSSPPKPPTVDESSRRPANSAMAVELQVCRNDLHNTRISATESGRLAESLAATAAQLAARQQVLAQLQAPPANHVYSIRFEFGSARVLVPADTAAALIEDARSAPLVLLRGRTDGTVESAAESRIARERAAAVRDYLVAAGVDAAHIRATYQPAGDHTADNTSASGRSMNRRVEVEVYRAVPLAMGSSPAERP
jgi:outer membrane protein OmpA-like peptidoglycan-associated protein